MSTFLLYRFSRPAVIVILACTAVVLLAHAGLAATKVLSGTHSESEIKSTCSAAGGTFTGGSGAAYGCFTDKGAVNCNSKGLCVGECAKCAQVAKGVTGVLRPPASAGAASAAGRTTTTRRLPVNNVNQSVASQRSGQSGGTKH